MAMPSWNPLYLAASILRQTLIVFAVVAWATAAMAASEDPNETLSQYSVFRLDAEEGSIYVRRLDQRAEQLWLDPRQVDEFDIGLPRYLGLDGSNRFLWLTRDSQYGESVVIDLVSGRHGRLSDDFSPWTLAANGAGDQFIVRDRSNVHDRRMTPRLFDGNPDGNPVGMEAVWFSDLIRSRFEPWAYVEAQFAGDDFIVVTGNGLSRGSSAFPIVVADARSGAIIAEFEPKSLINACQVIDLRDGEIFCLHVGTSIVRLDAQTGERRASYPRPGRDGRSNGILARRDEFIAISNQAAQIELLSFNPKDGSILDTTTLPGWIDEVDMPPPGDVAFLHITDARGLAEGVLPVLLDSFQPAPFIPHDPNDDDQFAIGRRSPEWTPPALSTRTPTSTRTPNPTSSPTPTPCQLADITLRLHPETARPGESVELHVDVASPPGCLLAFGANFAPRDGVRLETGGHRSNPCASQGNEDPSLFSSFSIDCDSSGNGCTAGTSLLKSGYSHATGSAHPMPERFSIRCRATVPLDAVPAEGHVGVTLVEFDRHGRRPAVERLVPLRVAGVAFTPTPSATATPTRTTTFTPTRRSAPTPCADCPALVLQPVQAKPGGVAVVDVRLRSAGQRIVALQTDLVLPTGLVASGAATWRCRGNPFLRQRASFQRSDCDGGICRSMRALLYDLEAGAPPLLDGMTIFTCRIAIAPTAVPGRHELILSKTLGSDAGGRLIPLAADATLVTIR